MRWRQGAESCSIPAGVGQALAKWMRQRRGAPIPNADVPQAPASGRQFSAPLSTPAFGPSLTISPYDSHQRTKGPEWVPITILNIATMLKPKLAPARQ
jgi:hypothetical protein